MMKKIVKKLFVMAMAVAVATTALPVMSVEAAISAPSSVTLNRTTTKDSLNYSSFSVSGLTKSTKIYPAKMKSSNKAVMVPYYMEKSNYNSSYEYTYVDENGKITGDPYKSKYESYTAYVGFKVKKAGTANLSYKIGNKNYTTKITAKAYKNPIKTAKIAGIKSGSSTNLADKLKKENFVYLKLSGNKKNASIQMAANSGWRITEIEVRNNTDGTTYSVSNYGQKGVGSANLNVGTMKKTESYTIEVDSVNISTGAPLTSYFYINQN